MLYRLGIALAVLGALVAVPPRDLLPSAAASSVAPVARPFDVALPLAASVYGYSPRDLDSIYGLSGTVSSNATVAVIAAGRNPQISSEVATYRGQFGLPACGDCLTEVNESGATSPLPSEILDAQGNAPWHLETALDAEVVTALCPTCHVVVVEANSASVIDLAQAADAAVRVGAQYVSMSFGAGEWAGESSLDSHLSTPGVVYVAATGDSGYGTAWPAVSPNVVAVGGASVVGSAATGWRSTAWNGAGAGCSTYEQRGVVQSLVTGVVSGVLGGHCTGRVVSDMAGVADPQHGVATYSQGAWYSVGGTSAAAPAVAALFALAGNHSVSAVYDHPEAFVDIKSGTTLGCPSGAGALCNAQPGWDGPTGLGLPYGLVAFGGAPTPPPPLAPPTALARMTRAVISGRGTVGSRLWAHPGAFVDAETLLPVPVSVNYQWYAGSKPLRGAAGPSLKVARQLRQKNVWFRATITSPGYVTRIVTSPRRKVS